MRTTQASLAIILCVVGSASLSAQTAPIDNSKRPGAGAPNCAKLAETADKCVFHTKKDQVDIVRLPLTAGGGSWRATASDATSVLVRESKVETLPDGTRQQTIQVIPQTPGDADVGLKLERRSQANAAAPAETRSVNLMIHALTTP